MREEGAEVGSVDELVRLADEDDSRAVAAIRRAGRHIGEVLATAVGLLNPSVTVLGGGHLWAGVREVVYARSPALSTQYLVIAPAADETVIGVVGASLWVIDEALEPDLVDSLVATQSFL
jgi:predicted NBD/HSP70 family sugar kinase